MYKTIIKKATALVLTATIALSISACGSEQQIASDVAVNSQEATSQTGTVTSGQEATTHLPATIQAAMEQTPAIMEMFSVAGMTVAIVDAHNDFIWTQGFGYADIQSARVVDEYTIFPVASVSKLFTAISIMQLVEDGKLDLDEPIITYLPDFSIQSHPVYGGDYRNITTRMLLTHTSGILDDFFTAEHITAVIDGRSGHDSGLVNNLLPRLANDYMQNREAERMTYTNNGSLLLGILVSRLSGYEDYFWGFNSYARNNILAPLGMELSSFTVTDYNRPYLTMPHINADMPFPYTYYINLGPTGGLLTNANEIAMFMQALLTDGGGIISAETIQEMITVQDFDFTRSAPLEMGLGFMHIVHPDGFRTIGHPGNIISFGSQMVMDFETGLGVLVSGNSTTSFGASSMLATTLLRTAVAERTGVVAEVQEASTPEPVERTAEYLQQFAGYFTKIGEIAIVDGVLHIINAPHAPGPLPLTPLDDGSFVCPMHGSIRFIEMENGSMTIWGPVIEFGGTFGLIGTRVYFTQAGEGFERFVGNYLATAYGMIAGMTIGIDEDGYAFAAQETFMGETTIIRLEMVDDYIYYMPGTERGHGIVFAFNFDDYGIAHLMASGSHFVRNEAE